MTVGRSEQANTLEVDRDLKVLSTVGWVPRVTFLRSLRAPGGGKETQVQVQFERWVYQSLLDLVQLIKPFSELCTETSICLLFVSPLIYSAVCVQLILLIVACIVLLTTVHILLQADQRTIIYMHTSEQLQLTQNELIIFISLST